MAPRVGSDIRSVSACGTYPGSGPFLITGASGMLGTALGKVLGNAADNHLPLSRADLDITDAEACEDALASFASEGGRVVINAAAYTDVERAEEEPEEAFKVNDKAAGTLAQTAARLGLGFVHPSTDFIFDGEKADPYTEEDQPHPINAYGRSKLAGERSVAQSHPGALIVRTSWVYGPGGRNFPAKIFRLALEQPELRVVCDEVGSPTYTEDLARGILGLIETGAKGMFHLSGFGHCSRYELAKEIVETAGLDTQVIPVDSSAFPTKAKRPALSVLSCAKAEALGVTMPPWRTSLRAYVRELSRQESAR